MDQEDKCTINRIQGNSTLVLHRTMFIFDVHYFAFQIETLRRHALVGIGAKSILKKLIPNSLQFILFLVCFYCITLDINFIIEENHVSML